MLLSIELYYSPKPYEKAVNTVLKLNADFILFRVYLKFNQKIKLSVIEVHSPPLNTWKWSSSSWNQLPIENKHVVKGKHIFQCATQRGHAEDNSHLRKPFHTILVEIRNVFCARNVYVLACREYNRYKQ